MPQVTARGFVRFLKAQGFVEGRPTGSHLTLWHAERNLSVTIPIHTACEIGRGLATRILNDADFTVDDCLRLR